MPNPFPASCGPAAPGTIAAGVAPQGESAVNSKQLKGLAVISIADGEKLGTVDGIFVEPAAKQVVGFAVKHGGGLLHPAQPDLIDVDDVHSLGPDALTLDDKGRIRGDQTRARRNELVELDDLLKRKVVTEGGTFVGQVAGVDVDEATFRLQQVEVSPGFFKSNRQVPIDQVVSVGHDLIVVADAVCAADAGAGGSMPVAEGDRRFVVGDVVPKE